MKRSEDAKSRGGEEFKSHMLLPFPTLGLESQWSAQHSGKSLMACDFHHVESHNLTLMGRKELAIDSFSTQFQNNSASVEHLKSPQPS